MKAVASSDVTLHCPYSGYPIEAVRWERYGQELPLDLRHRIDGSGSFTIISVDQTADSGYYTCSVTNREGEVAKREIQLIVHSPPILEPFSFPTSLQEGGRAQVTCYVTSGDMPIHFSWYKDDAPIPSSLQVKKASLTLQCVNVHIFSKLLKCYCRVIYFISFHQHIVFTNLCKKNRSKYCNANGNILISSL